MYTVVANGAQSPQSCDMDEKAAPCRQVVCRPPGPPGLGGGARPARGVVVALDNDECVGSWADLSILYTFYREHLRTDPPVELFVQLLDKLGCVRPHLAALYDLLAEARADGRVRAVVMCTAARNVTGWVTFLAHVLEAWYCEPVYDYVMDGDLMTVMHQEQGTLPFRTSGGGMVKDMNHVRQVVGVPPECPVVILDDRPENVVNGSAVPVPPYHVAVNLVAVLELYEPAWRFVSSDLRVAMADVMQQSWRLYQEEQMREQAWCGPGPFPCMFSDGLADRGLVGPTDCLHALISDHEHEHPKMD